MKISEDYRKYLLGEKFSTGARLPLFDKQDLEKLDDRLTYVSEYCKGKKVLHVGCCDHKDVIAKKRKAKRWLHDLITEKAEVCLGIDICEDTVKYLKEEEHVENIIILDITKPINLDSPVYKEKWDVIVLGEVLEHISNPVAFLSAFYDVFKTIAKEVLITVPNAFSEVLDNYKNIGVECINTDHRFWFTPFTLAKVVTDAGFYCTELYFVWSFPQPPYPRKNFIKRWFMKKRRTKIFNREGLVIHALFDSSNI